MIMLMITANGRYCGNDIKEAMWSIEGSLEESKEIANREKRSMTVEIKIESKWV